MLIIAIKAIKITIHILQIAQMLGSNFIQVATLKQENISTKILNKYLDFLNRFLKKEVLVLPKQKNLNKYTIKLKKDK